MGIRYLNAAALAGLAAVLLLAAHPSLAQSSGESALTRSAGEAATPPMWRVVDDDSEIFLLGTIHVLHPNLDWRPTYLAKALDTSEDFLWLEADTETRPAQIRAADFATAEGRLPVGQSLPDMLDHEDADRLRKMVTEIGAPMSDFETMRPWLAYLSLSFYSAAAEGFDPNVGVEKVLTSEWRARGRKIRYFESIEEQLSILAALAPDVQKNLLVKVLREWDRGEASLEGLFSAWWAGDAQAINDIMNDTLRQEAPEVFVKLVTERNEGWVKQIALEMQGAGKGLIAVGAGHLAGEGSVPALLKANGFKVERYGVAADAEETAPQTPPPAANDNAPEDKADDAIGDLLEDLDTDENSEQ